LAKHSTKLLFYKDYNWLGVFLNGLMQAKIMNELIEGVSFFDSLSRNLASPGTVFSPSTWFLQKNPFMQHDLNLGLRTNKA